MSRYPFGLCDLHCDTLYEISDAGTGLYNDRHHISFDKTDDFASYTQVMAIWSNVRVPEEECWEAFGTRSEYFKNEVARHPEIMFCRNAAELSDAWNKGKKAIVLGVEGGKLLGGNLSRVDALYEAGVRFLTLVWGSETSMGGAHDVGGGLSPFGVSALKRMLEIGIIPDVSHASREIFYQTAAYADMFGKPFVATHSDSFAVREHTRNLTDEQFRMVRDAGGLVGVSLCTSHLSADDTCTVSTVADHFEHYLSLGGEKTVCLGCDLDGIDTLPAGMRDISSLSMIADELLRRNIPEETVADIFCNNVKSFLMKNL